MQIRSPLDDIIICGEQPHFGKLRLSVLPLLLPLLLSAHREYASQETHRLVSGKWEILQEMRFE